MLTDFGWRDVAALLTSAGLISIMVISWVKYRLSGDFASKADISGLSGRIEAVEQQMASMPTREDMQRVSERMGALEREVAIATTEIRAGRDSMARIERDLHLMVQHHLKTGS